MTVYWQISFKITLRAHTHTQHRTHKCFLVNFMAIQDKIFLESTHTQLYGGTISLWSNNGTAGHEQHVRM
uniref:Uncharacterized protein n=1 Tax=Anguilla anguilla TaxID=7936 RepID=A0A0E9X5P3_ANGAN